MQKSFLLAGAALVALSTAASAATFTIDGTAGFIPEAGQTNEVLENVFGINDGIRGFFGSTVSIDEAATIDVNFFGFEAGFSNSFSITGTDPVSSTALTDGFSTEDPGYGAGSAYATSISNPLDMFQINVGSGQLDFSFATNGNIAVDKTVKNGENHSNTESPAEVNFFTSLSADAKTVFLFFDDTGAGDDDNHDDFVVSLSIGPAGQEPPAVPLPAGGLLLIGGLGALAVARRRKVKA
ncbi:MAG: VPLPA-CTERM sorting domain-containing protein [Pseudomonadota bacterium]